MVLISYVVRAKCKQQIVKIAQLEIDPYKTTKKDLILHKCERSHLQFWKIFHAKENRENSLINAI